MTYVDTMLALKVMDVASSSTGEVAIVQADVPNIIVFALTVLLNAPVHFILHCRIGAAGLFPMEGCHGLGINLDISAFNENLSVGGK